MSGNGDGFQDIAIGVPTYSTYNLNDGVISVIFGNEKTNQNFELPPTLDRTKGFKIIDPSSKGYIGAAISDRDINEDGLSDIVFVGEGHVYVVYGGKDNVDVNLAAGLPFYQGFSFKVPAFWHTGEEGGYRSEHWQLQCRWL